MNLRIEETVEEKEAVVQTIMAVTSPLRARTGLWLKADKRTFQLADDRSEYDPSWKSNTSALSTA